MCKEFRSRKERDIGTFKATLRNKNEVGILLGNLLVSAVFFAKPIAGHDPASSGQLQGRASGLLLQAEVHP